METIKTHNPILVDLTWLEAKTRDGRQLVGGPMYAVKGMYVYRRKSNSSKTYTYYRVQINRVFLLTYWYEIQDSWWEPVTEHGIPIPRELSR